MEFSNMKIKLKTALSVIALATSLQSAALAQGIPVIDASAIAKYVEQIAQMKEQIDNQVKQITELKNQVTAMTGTRNMGDLLKDTLSSAVPDDWQSLYKQVNINLESMQNPSQYDPSSSLNNLASIYELTQNSLNKSKTITSEIELLMFEINNTQDIKAAADLQSRISAQQAALTLNQSNLDQAYRAYEINEKMINNQRREHTNCLMKAWAERTDKNICG